jgi:hypothetical protein
MKARAQLLTVWAARAATRLWARPTSPQRSLPRRIPERTRLECAVAISSLAAPRAQFRSEPRWAWLRDRVATLRQCRRPATAPVAPISTFGSIHPCNRASGSDSMSANRSSAAELTRTKTGTCPPSARWRGRPSHGLRPCGPRVRRPPGPRSTRPLRAGPPSQADGGTSPGRTAGARFPQMHRMTPSPTSPPHRRSQFPLLQAARLCARRWRAPCA